MDTQFTTAAVLSLVLLSATTAWHHYALQFLGRISAVRPPSRGRVVAFLVALIGVHLAQVGLYALAYAVGDQVMKLGSLLGPDGNTALDYFYFAAETYSTLGYGDIVPIGALRLVASVESLNGLLLLAWSGAFLYGVLDGPGYRSGRDPEEKQKP